MSVRTNDAIDYLTPSLAGFWAWDGETIVFANGATLTFREELLAVVRRLTPFGLPPLDSLLLFLAAGREGWALPGGGREALRDSLERLFLPLEGWRDQLDAVLFRINGLGPAWRRELGRKALLAEVIFEDGHRALRLSEDASRAVLDLLESGFVPPPKMLSETGRQESWRRLVASLRPLVSFEGPLDSERLELRWRTGLDRCLQVEARDVSPALRVRSLLTELEGDPEYGGLARLAKNLMAAVHVPRALTDPDEMPLGGFSDIANRGSLDRLLVSELAQDDLVLSVRLALNEALYLRRESPPKTPQNARILLIDNGLRLWGVPRLFAMAAGMAVAATAPRKVPLQVLVPTETQQLAEIDLGNRRSLVEALSHLHPHAHPGNALLEMVNRTGAPDAKTNDFILITHPAVLDDESFQSVLRLLSRDLYVATVDRTGRYAFHVCGQEKRRLLKEARFDLDAILEPERREGLRSPRLLADERSKQLPVLLRREPFPLLLPVDLRRNHLLLQEGGERLWVTRDGRILEEFGPSKGGRQIYDRVPKGQPLPIDVVRGLPQTVYVALFGGDGRLTLLLLAKDGGLTRAMQLDVRRRPLQAVIDHQLLLLVQPRAITVHDCLTGEQLGERGLDHRVVRALGNQVFLSGQWYRLGLDGYRPVLESIQEGDLEQKGSRPIPHFRFSFYKRFRAAGVTAEGRLVLVTRSGAQLAITPNREMSRLGFQVWEKEVETVLFEKVAGPLGTRFRLAEARITPEHRVILDSRGLLHLTGPDPRLPEITFILTQSQPLSGWASNEETFGYPFFFPQEPTVQASVFWDYLRTWGRSALMTTSV